MTIHDVAKAAGVSKSTVSLVLQDSPKVAPRTREAVWAAFQKTGYVPNAAARTLAVGRTRVIGLATGNFSQKLTERAYFASIVGALLETLAAKRYHLMIYNAALPLQLAVDGMLFLALEPDHPLVEQVQRAHLPFVFLNRRAGDDKTPYVSQDFVQGGKLAAQHLIGLGHRRIGMLTGRLTSPPHHDRYLGWQMALKQASGDKAEPQVAECLPLSAGAGYEGAKRLLSQDDRPTAVFVANYELLPGLMTYCREHEITIPDQLSIVCYDDPWIAESIHPAVTAIRSANEKVGHLGAHLIIDLAENRSPGNPQQLVCPQLVVRDSTLPLPEATVR